MNGLERFFAPTQPPISTSTDLVATNFDDYTLQVMLFRALHGFSKQAKGSNMLYNLQAAAFHLSFMLKGHTANEKLVSLSDLAINYHIWMVVRRFQTFQTAIRWSTRGCRIDGAPSWSLTSCPVVGQLPNQLD